MRFADAGIRIYGLSITRYVKLCLFDTTRAPASNFWPRVLFFSHARILFIYTYYNDIAALSGSRQIAYVIYLYGPYNVCGT